MKDLSETYKQILKRMKYQTMYIERRINMSIKDLYLKAEVLKEIDDNLEHKVNSLKEDVDATNEYLEVKRCEEENINLTEEEFARKYDWKYDMLEYENKKIRITEEIRAELTKLLK